MSTIRQDTFCPVCGFDLGFLPWNGDSPSDEICSSCGIQFGYTDMAGGNKKKRRELYKKWRNGWVQKGMNFKFKNERPQNWNPIEQLKKIGINIKDLKK